MRYQTGKLPTNMVRNGQFRTNQNGQRMFVNNGIRTGARPVSGEVTAVDSNSITVRMSDGSSKIVILSDSTKYVKTAETSKNEIKTGNQVGVFGITNTDGSVTAQNIQVNPQQINMVSGTPQKP